MTWRHMTLTRTVPKASRSRFVPASDLNICNHLSDLLSGDESKIHVFFVFGGALFFVICLLYKEKKKVYFKQQSTVHSDFLIYYRLLGLYKYFYSEFQSRAWAFSDGHLSGVTLLCVR